MLHDGHIEFKDGEKFPIIVIVVLIRDDDDDVLMIMMLAWNTNA